MDSLAEEEVAVVEVARLLDTTAARLATASDSSLFLTGVEVDVAAAPPPRTRIRLSLDRDLSADCCPTAALTGTDVFR